MSYSTLHPRLIRAVCEFSEYTNDYVSVAGKKAGWMVYLSYVDAYRRLPNTRRVITIDATQCHTLRGAGYVIIQNYRHVIPNMVDIINSMRNIVFKIYVYSAECLWDLARLQHPAFIHYEDGPITRQGYGYAGLHMTKIETHGDVDEVEEINRLDVADLDQLTYVHIRDDVVMPKIIELLRSRGPIEYLIYCSNKIDLRKVRGLAATIVRQVDLSSIIGRDATNIVNDFQGP